MHNVLHIVRNPALGGAEVLVKNIINADDSHEFRHFLLYSKEGPLLGLINENKRNRLLECAFNNRISFILKLRKILKKQKIDIVHVHQAIDTVYIILATFRLDIALVRTYHGYEGIDNSIKSFRKRTKLIKFYLHRSTFIYKKIRLHFFVSNNLKIKFRETNNNDDKQVVLYNGIDESMLINHVKINIMNELKFNDQNCLLFGMVGSFNKFRDHYTICKLMKILNNKNKQIHCLFVGRQDDGKNSEYGKCYQYCKKNSLLSNVHFLGERSDVCEILNCLQIYVQSSNNDTFGISLVEAMIAKIPCLASDIPPFREVSDNGKHVTLFRKGDVDDLFEKINSVILKLNSEELSVKCAEAKKFAIKNFSIQTHLKKLHSHYHRFSHHFNRH